jgi:uncharacterized delta-60 repeat protein
MRPRSIPQSLSVLNLAILLLASSYALGQAGTLDPTFGTGGIFQSPGTASAACALAIQSDGKIVVAGSGLASNGGGVDTLLRLNANGTLDTTFGTGGVFSISPKGAELVNGFFGVAIQTDGKIVAAASGLVGVQVVRVLSNGTLDTTFGTGGLTTSITAFGGIGGGGLALQSNGDIVVVAGSLNPSAMARFTSSGKLDTTFGSGGQVNLQYGTPTQVAIQSNGKILVTSGLSGKLVFFPFPNAQAGSITRYNSNGSVDMTFGAAGTAATVASASALVLQSDGKILVGGGLTSKVNAPGTANDVGFGIVRYKPNGTLDTAFGTGGVAVTDFGVTATCTGAYAVAVQSNGDIVAGGAAGNTIEGSFISSSFGLSRYTSTGQLDTTFGTGGITITSVASGEISWVNAMAIQSDGKIVVTGNALASVDSDNGYVARYLSE